MKNNKKNIILIISISIIVVLLIVIGVLAFLFLKTDVFASNKKLFTQYVSQPIEQFQTITSSNNYEKVLSKLEEKSSDTKTVISLSSDDIKKIDQYSLEMNTKNDAINKRLYNDIKVTNEGQKIAELEYIIADASLSLRLTDVAKQFLTVENRELSKLSEVLEMSTEDLEGMFELLEYKGIDEKKYPIKNFEFSEEEKLKLKEKYIQIVFNNLSKNNFSKQKDVMITINGSTITTNSYKLTITPDQYKIILEQLVENLKEDAIILSKIKSMENIFLEENDENMTDETEDSEEKDETFLNKMYIDCLDNILNKIDEIDSQENFECTVYENDKKTIRVKCEIGVLTIYIDALENNELIGLNCKLDMIKDNNQKISEINFTKYKSENYDYRVEFKNLLKFLEITDSETTLMLENKVNESESENEINIENNATLNVNDKVINLKITSNISFLDQITDMLRLNSVNNISINNLTRERFQQIMGLLGEGVVKTYQNTEIFNMFSLLSSTDNPIIQEALKIREEIEKNLNTKEASEFNATFEAFEGETIEASRVQELIQKIINNNISEAELTKKVSVTGDINITIFENQVPDNLIDHMKTYRVECYHNEVTGIVERVHITKNEEVELY